MKIQSCGTMVVALAVAMTTGCPTDLCGDKSCGDHGSCDAETGECACDTQWTGALCDTEEPLEIIGSYVDDWGFDHEITQASWVNMGSTFHTSQYSNAEDWLVAHNDAANTYNPDLWSRFDWTHSSGQLYYCQSAFDAASEQAALAVTPANSGDLSTGCGGYAWSTLSEPLAIRGTYVDDYTLVHEISQTAWVMPGSPSDSVFHISQFSNAGEFVIAHNDAANPYSADLWSRFDWTHDSASDLYYCQIVYEAADENAALAASGANRSDLSTGCNNFSWSKLTPQ
ncbi:MAG: calcium-binding EGF-like domain-containing protein [Pseudomonadota bacterium]